MKKIIVLGGGSAGWLTSLLTREFYPEFDITVVESEDIGILGAGEGTVPHFIDVLDFLKIPVSALVAECNATIKIGIKFTNWHGDNTSYFHDFIAKDDLQSWIFDDNFRTNILTTYLIGKGVPLDDINFYAQISEQGKVPFVLNDLNDITLSKFPDAVRSVQHLGSFALHFDARLLAAFLGKVAQQRRGINRVEGKYTKAITDENGFITGIQLESGQQLDCDFIFDCSGFSRLLLGKHFNEKWIDYKKHLPMDTALPFFIDHDGKNLPPYTEAIAMKYGWMWKIPVGNRYGCGYVFDSSYINEDQAKQEIEQHLGQQITSPKTFRFQAGRFENTLVKNCYGVGLAQHFVEPLEATSIWIFCVNLINFLKTGFIKELNPENTEFINARNREVIDPIPEFLHLHYLTERNDSPFWKEFRTRTESMESLNEKKRIWEMTPQFEPDIVHLRMFISPGWITVGSGTRFFNRDVFNRYTNSWDHQELERMKSFLCNKHAHLSRACMLHEDFLSLLRQKSQPIP